MARMRTFGPEYANTSVSSGTMRDEDVIPAMISTLSEIVPSVAARYQQRWNAIVASDQQETEEASWLSDDLYDELNNRAPEGCYFGAPGDGADYGFWEVEE
jgi:hypothetical protein